MSRTVSESPLSPQIPGFTFEFPTGGDGPLHNATDLNEDLMSDVEESSDDDDSDEEKEPPEMKFKNTDLLDNTKLFKKDEFNVISRINRILEKSSNNLYMIECYQSGDNELQQLANKNSDCYSIEENWQSNFVVLTRDITDNDKIVSFVSFGIYSHAVLPNEETGDVVRMEHSCTDKKHRNRGLSVVLRLVPVLFAQLSGIRFITSHAVAEGSQSLLKNKYGFKIYSTPKKFYACSHTYFYNAILDLKNDDTAKIRNLTLNVLDGDVIKLPDKKKKNKRKRRDQYSDSNKQSRTTMRF
jgi:hypothetical protein